jgi:hypothetical protein
MQFLFFQGKFNSWRKYTQATGITPWGKPALMENIKKHLC